MTPLRQNTVRNRLLQVLSAEDFARLQPHLQFEVMALKQMLIAPGTPIEHLYFPEAGFTSVTADGVNGRIEVGVIGREGVVGASLVLLGADRTPHSHFVQIAGSAFRIARDALCEAAEASPTLRKVLLAYVHVELIQARQTAFINATFDIETRLARWLLLCHDRIDGDTIVITHEFLSMMLGVQRAGVTLALQNLEGGRRINALRGRIEVIDRGSLEAVAAGSYGVTEAAYTRVIGAT